MEKQKELACLKLIANELNNDMDEMMKFLISQLLHGMMRDPSNISREEFLDFMGLCWDGRKAAIIGATRLGHLENNKGE